MSEVPQRLLPGEDDSGQDILIFLKELGDKRIPGIVMIKRAADEITRLRAENARLREALEWYASGWCEYHHTSEPCGLLSEDNCSGCRARKALKGE